MSIAFICVAWPKAAKAIKTTVTFVGGFAKKVCQCECHLNEKFCCQSFNTFWACNESDQRSSLLKDWVNALPS
jgi:hypothetical protein